MRLISTITGIALTCGLFGCSTAQMIVPQDVLSMDADQHVATERKRATGAFVNESFKLGPYVIKDVDRDWDSSKSMGIAGFSKKSSTSGYQFTFDSGSGDLSAQCEIEESAKGVKLMAGLSASTSASKIGCSCQSSGGTAEVVAEVILDAKNDSKFEGTVKTRSGEYAIKAIYEADGRLSNGNPSGYRVDGDSVVAASDVLFPGKVWLKKELSQEDKDDLSCIFSGLMLYTGKKN